MSKEELEQYSYTDLAAMILKEEKKSLNTPDIFKKICKLLEMTDDEYASKIGDFYTALTTDKTFILLDDAHSVKITLNDDETEDEEDLSETEEELDDELDDMASEDMHDMDDDSDLDDPDLDDVDDVEDVDDDLTIIDEEELD